MSGIIDNNILERDSADGENKYCTLFEGIPLIPDTNADAMGFYTAYALSAPDPIQELTGGDPIPYYSNIVEITYASDSAFAMSLFRQILSRWKRTFTTAESVRDVKIIQDQQLPYDESQDFNQRQTAIEVTTFEPDP